MSDPWAFGWTQPLTLIGFAITIGIAAGGYQTFSRWKRQKIEERRIETAIDALALAYESKIVFQAIRSGFASNVDYKDMKGIDGESEDQTSNGARFG
jgi:hypothetical protein